MTWFKSVGERRNFFLSSSLAQEHRTRDCPPLALLSSLLKPAIPAVIRVRMWIISNDSITHTRQVATRPTAVDRHEFYPASHARDSRLVSLFEWLIILALSGAQRVHTRSSNRVLDSQVSHPLTCHRSRLPASCKSTTESSFLTRL